MSRSSESTELTNRKLRDPACRDYEQRGSERLAISIVPDSGTEELAGIIGELLIKIVDGKHFYELGYTFRQE